MVLNLTAQDVKALKPRDERYGIGDERVTGLSIRVSPTGAKVWALLYRVRGVQRRLKIGEYPRMSLAEARKRATAELRKVDGGLDPQAERSAVRLAEEQARKDSIEALTTDFIEKHAKVKKRSWRDDQSKIKREILPRWRGRPVSGITRRDCRELTEAISHRGAPVFADRTSALLSRLFRFAVDQEIVQSNVAANLPKFGGRPDPDATRAYSDDEVREIWKATEKLAPALRALYRLGFLTGARPAELSNMQWGELASDWWTIPAARAKNGREHRVFLTTTAREILDDIPKDDPVYVFNGFRGKRQLGEINAQVFVKVGQRSKPRHAIRATVASGLAACGVSVADIGRILNHAIGAPVDHVQHLPSHFDVVPNLLLPRLRLEFDGSGTSPARAE